MTETDALAYWRREVARVERQRDQWQATAAQLQRDNTALRAEILRLQAYERAAYRADL